MIKPEYLQSLVLPPPVLVRIESIFNFYKNICKEDILNIFVTDYLEKDGSRVFENLWFFSKNYFMEAKKFITEYDFDMTPINKRIDYWNIKEKDYDFNLDVEVGNAKLYIKFASDVHISGELKATGKNCSKLKEIFTQYILPNLKE